MIISMKKIHQNASIKFPFNIPNLNSSLLPFLSDTWGNMSIKGMGKGFLLVNSDVSYGTNGRQIGITAFRCKARVLS